MKRSIIVTALLATGLLLAACGGSTETPAPTAAPPPTDTPAPAAPVAEHAEEAIVLVDEHAEEAAPLVEEHAEEAPTAAPPAPTPTPEPAGPPRVGLLTISDGEVHSDLVTLQMSGVAPLLDDAVYEAWLQGGDQPPLSLGRLTVSGDSVEHTYLEPQGANLLGLYDRAFISLEPANDPDPNPSGVVVYAGEIAPEVIAAVRLLVFFSPDSPDGDGLALNALAEGLRVQRIAQSQQQDVAEGNLVNLRQHAEAIINTLEGKNGPNYGDSDGDGQVTDPSDGVGLLSFEGSEGYLQRTAILAGQAGGVAGVTAEVIRHADGARISAENATGWAQIIRDLELSILEAQTTAEAADLVTGMLDLANALAEGVDANGDGLIAPEPAEGGVRTMYAESQRLAAIEFFAVATPEPAGGPEPGPEPPGEHAEEPVDLPSPTPAPEPTATPTPELISEHDGG